jgi:hypothetical protein
MRSREAQNSSGERHGCRLYLSVVRPGRSRNRGTGIVWELRAHVSIGADQHVSPGSVPDYTQWVHLVAAMLRGGFTREEAGKIAGGNYMRIFRAAVA